MKFTNEKDLACYLIDNAEEWFNIGEYSSCGFIDGRFKFKGSRSDSELGEPLCLSSWIYGEVTKAKKIIGINSLGDEFYEGDQVWWYIKGSQNIVEGDIKNCSVVEEFSFCSETYKTKEQAQTMLNRYKVEKAFSEGKAIEFCKIDDLTKEWHSTTAVFNPSWSWNRYEYRIAEEKPVIVINGREVTAEEALKILNK